MSKAKSEAIAQLLMDKHTLLEGYITEYLFEHQFLKPADMVYTHGWWTGVVKDRRFVFILKKHLSAFDREVIGHINSVFECYQVIHSHSGWTFRKGPGKWNQEDFLKMINITHPMCSPCHATDQTRDIDRQGKCIDFFLNHKTVIKTAQERSFVNNFLSRYLNSIMNIDYLAKDNKGKLYCIEVKFKCETYDGNFGLNTGEVELFRIFKQLGFHICHAILYKTRENGKLSIFDYLDHQELDRAWYIKILDRTINNVQVKTAPKETSVYGNKSQRYVAIPAAVFLQEPNKRPLNIKTGLGNYDIQWFRRFINRIYSWYTDNFN